MFMVVAPAVVNMACFPECIPYVLGLYENPELAIIYYRDSHLNYIMFLN